MFYDVGRTGKLPPDGHLDLLVAWHKHLSNAQPMPKPARAPPLPPQPLTLTDLVADTFPTFDGLRAFYFLCSPVSPDDVLNAVKRRMR
jgi:hypothetical protein